MNKTAIKNFAIWARNKLIADISYRAGLMGITAEGIQNALPQSTGTTEFYDIGTAEPYSISGDAVKQRNHLVELIRRKEKETNYKTAYKYVLEEVAYTWFNRLIAVRFMEVNDYLPSHIRVLSSDSGKMEPDLVTNPFDAELAFSRDEEQTIYQLKQENKIDEVFRILFIKQCNALNEILPALFEKTSDYTELLLNLSVIDQESVVYHLVHDIPEEDFDVERGGQVEIIGWLYQYYNTEPKNEAFAKSGKISKEEIPAVTQLFTPDWVVRYMVENSIGRLWIEHLRALDESADEAAIASSFGWKYYLPEAEQEPVVEAKLHELRKGRATLTPEQITMIDPCMGSGHILVYAFNVLMQIYENAGYGQRDAAMSILENNLFGLDIDDRAYQMAYFAVMMKAREYNRRILNGQNKCNVYAIQETNGIEDAALDDMGASLTEEDRKKALKEVKALIAEFKDAKEFGSILNVEKRDWDLLRGFAVPNIGVGQLKLDMNGAEAASALLQEIIDIADALSNTYMATVTNPPYMGSSNMDKQLSAFTKKEYPNSKVDMSTVFMERNLLFTNEFGLISMINIPVWMFLSKFEKLRNVLLSESDVINMPHFGRGVFGSDFGTTAFVLRKGLIKGYKGLYLRLFDSKGAVDSIEEKERRFNAKEGQFISKQDNFIDVPNKIYAYWLSDTVLHTLCFGEKLSTYGTARQGLATTDNNLYLRLWYEVKYSRIGFGCLSTEETKNNGVKWYPYIKGGDYRKWAGNYDYIVNYENDGESIKDSVMTKYPYLNGPGFVVKNTDTYFHKGITWNDVSMGRFHCRYVPSGFIYDAAGPMYFSDNSFEMLAYFNSKVFQLYADVICQGLHYSTGHIPEIPYIRGNNEKHIADLAKDCYEMSLADWANAETYWGFLSNPLVKKNVSTVKEAFTLWDEECRERLSRIRANENEINEYYISLHGLSDELSPEVDADEIALRGSNLKRDISSLLSYAVGCMFGRYSLQEEGLIYAGGIWDDSKYSKFLPDIDNVIPISDEEYLEDDIVSRLCTFLKVTFGDGTLEENLDYIAKVLGNKGDSSREVIRNYFLNDFFKDHCQTYSVTGSGKRPIYWLFDSGKQNGFKALIYLHRYNADTIGNLRIDYLHRMQRIYESEISRMQDMIDHSTSAREVAQATKRREKLQKQLKECREYDEKLAHLALSRIELDLDDGVKKNYRKIQTANDGKFYEVLADSKNIMAKE